MIEYISREDAVCVADYAVDEHPYDKIPGKPETFSEYNQGWHDACDYIRKTIDALAPADVEAVRHGYWQVRKNDLFGLYVQCSICGSKHVKREWDDNYAESESCPRCGAKMDGGNNNDD